MQAYFTVLVYVAAIQSPILCLQIENDNAQAIEDSARPGTEVDEAAVTKLDVETADPLADPEDFTDTILEDFMRGASLQVKERNGKAVLFPAFQLSSLPTSTSEEVSNIPIIFNEHLA